MKDNDWTAVVERVSQHSQGFTLLEILVTVLIVGVVASIAMVNYSVTIEKMRAQEGEQIIYVIFADIKRQITEGQSMPTLAKQYSSNIILNPTNFQMPIYSYTTSATGVKGMICTVLRKTGQYALVATWDQLSTKPQILCGESPPTTGICTKIGY